MAKKCIYFSLQAVPTPCSFRSASNIKLIYKEATLDHAHVTALVSNLWNQHCAAAKP
jgi:hypothetical protein